jgi:hypothetical protein
VRKIYGPIKEGEHWRIKANTKIKDVLQGENFVKLVKPRRLRCVVILEEYKIRECQNKLQQLQWTEQRKEEDHVEREGRG